MFECAEQKRTNPAASDHQRALSRIIFATLQAQKLNLSFNEGELSNIALAKEKQICLFALWQEGSGFCFEDITHTRAVWRERLRSNTLDRRTCE
jgi:hypothetical protein